MPHTLYCKKHSIYSNLKHRRSAIKRVVASPTSQPFISCISTWEKMNKQAMVTRPWDYLSLVKRAGLGIFAHWYFYVRFNTFWDFHIPNKHYIILKNVLIKIKLSTTISSSLCICVYGIRLFIPWSCLLSLDAYRSWEYTRQKASWRTTGN